MHYKRKIEKVIYRTVLGYTTRKFIRNALRPKRSNKKRVFNLEPVGNFIARGCKNIRRKVEFKVQTTKAKVLQEKEKKDITSILEDLMV